MTGAQTTTQPLVVSFSGPIRHEATKMLRNWICSAASGQFTEMTLLFNSWGGNLSDGFGLYNLLRALPVPLTAVNVGSVESIAVSVFLAADTRIACPGTRFLLHDFTWTFGDRETLTPNLIEERSAGLDFDKGRYRRLLVDRCNNVTDASLDDMKLFEKPIVLDAPAAKEAGIVKEVSEYTIPTGCRVLNLDY